MLIRAMNQSDVPAGLRLCRASGWNQIEEDWSLVLQLSPAGCRVAEQDGKVIGSVATLRYQDQFGWVSMVLVDPQYRRSGIGTRLLSEALALLHDVSCIRLDATPAGRAMYLQYGFLDEHPISRWTAMAGVTEPRSVNIRRMSEKDFQAMLAKDRQVFGADRTPILQSLFDRSPAYAGVTGNPDMRGYCLGRPGFRYHQLGPVIAENEDVARELVAHSLAHTTGQPFAIDTPRHSPSWLRWLRSAGFVEERSFVRMYRGRRNTSEITQRIYATAGPEFG